MDDQSFGLSVVQRIAKPVTIEGILDFRRRDLSAALVPRIHSRVVGRRLNAFFGIGPHAGYVKVDETTVAAVLGFRVYGRFGVQIQLAAHPHFLRLPTLSATGWPPGFVWFSIFVCHPAGQPKGAQSLEGEMAEVERKCRRLAGRRGLKRFTGCFSSR
jgi:hypothetical protein